jgi:hypothetical protein
MSRSEFLLKVSFVVALAGGSVAVHFLHTFTTLPAVAVFGISIAAAMGVFVMFVAVLSALGY